MSCPSRMVYGALLVAATAASCATTASTNGSGVSSPVSVAAPVAEATTTAPLRCDDDRSTWDFVVAGDYTIALASQGPPAQHATVCIGTTADMAQGTSPGDCHDLGDASPWKVHVPAGARLTSLRTGPSGASVPNWHGVCASHDATAVGWWTDPASGTRLTATLTPVHH